MPFQDDLAYIFFSISRYSEAKIKKKFNLKFEIKA